MLNRLLVALIGIPALMFLYYSGGIYLLIFTCGVISVGLYEFYKMAENIGRKPYKNLGMLTGILIPISIYFLETNKIPILLVILLLMVSLSVRVFENKIEKATEDVGITVLGVIYVSLMFSHILLIDKLTNGWKWVIAIQVMVWLCDSAAYFVGMKFGRKFFKEGLCIISPKKSKEGLIGGVTFTVLGIYLIDSYFGLGLGSIGAVVLGIAVSIVATMGDLAESLFKREFQIKDSGKLLGEHGGILDRFDSMLFVIPTVYYILEAFLK